jgi:hypothetical protein
LCAIFIIRVTLENGAESLLQFHFVKIIVVVVISNPLLGLGRRPGPGVIDLVIS